MPAYKEAPPREQSLKYVGIRREKNEPHGCISSDIYKSLWLHNVSFFSL